jgi:crotonobetainyl-CoA:carnitine CoA-transferase CaiB-like acyl-CoA transferase
VSAGKALHGLRVVDITTSLAGPYCTLILGALGADVVKVERPASGDDTRAWGPPFLAGGQSPTFLAMNANKRSLAIDLRSEHGAVAVRRLADGCDIFVQNLRPGTADRLGLSYETLSATNERLLYCSIGAFGSVGPLAQQPGYDPLMQAAAGIMSVTGEQGGEAVRAGVSLVDQGTGMWAAIGILAALMEGVRPRLIETSLYETAVNWLPYQLVSYMVSRREPERMGSGLAMIAPYQAFETADERIMVAAANDSLFGRLCAAIGLPELAEDPRFLTNADRVEHRTELSALLAVRLRTEPRGVWLERLASAGVPAAPVNGLGAVVASEQTAALGLLQRVEGRTPDLELVSPPLSLDRERIKHRSGPPDLGEHSVEVLRELGYPAGEIDRLVEAGVVECPAVAVER